ncbi:hypothetical protein GCM10011329_23050 [Stakelama pacifica]|nr:hypothetical protein GCM10011329_23050 [Stakelama pacifica]
MKGIENSIDGTGEAQRLPLPIDAEKQVRLAEAARLVRSARRRWEMAGLIGHQAASDEVAR